MFTGIVEEMGEVIRAGWEGESYRMAVKAVQVLAGTRLGDSIAVNGTCLTVAELSPNHIRVGLAPETLSRTNLGSIAPGARVNLERSLTPLSRMGGHFVQGHVDGVGRIVDRTPDGDSLRLVIEADSSLLKWIVPKGFIALDGISLTVVEAGFDRFSIMLIDYTLQHVTLSGQDVGYLVNIEVDILAKYVERILQARTV